MLTPNPGGRQTGPKGAPICPRRGKTGPNEAKLLPKGPNGLRKGPISVKGKSKVIETITNFIGNDGLNY